MITTTQDKIYIGTNTKMYKGISDTVSYIDELARLTEDIDRTGTELFVIPSFTTLASAAAAAARGKIRLGAQNMCWEEQGQFTGEVSPLMLNEVSVSIVELGHSERRHVFGESDLMIRKKVNCAVSHQFTALLCIGETEEQKELGLSEEILRSQIKSDLADLREDQLDYLWLAYEPVWAIGVNGKPASAEYAGNMHGAIRNTLAELFGSRAREIPLLYGGSVNAQNACSLIQTSNIDGLFIGRSAWNAQDFNHIIRDVLQCRGHS